MLWVCSHFFILASGISHSTITKHQVLVTEVVIIQKCKRANFIPQQTRTTRTMNERMTQWCTPVSIVFVLSLLGSLPQVIYSEDSEICRNHPTWRFLSADNDINCRDICGYHRDPSEALDGGHEDFPEPETPVTTTS